MRAKTTNHYLAIFLYAALAWMALGALHLASLALGNLQAGGEHDLSLGSWLVFLSVYLSWAFLTTFVYWLLERDLPSRYSWRWLWRFVLTMTAWVLAVSLMAQALASLADGAPPEPVGVMLVKVTPFLYLFNALKFVLTYGVCSGIIYYRRLLDARLALLELERNAAAVMERKSRLELQALQSQLSPHFLFNALNAVSGLARNEDSNGVVDAVSRLGELLRYAVEATRQVDVLLEDELRFTANYVALQAIRFGAGFHYDVRVAPADRHARCPPFCIQTLVENVFAHNDVCASRPVGIAVDAARSDGCLVVSVTNSADAAEATPGTGTGLRNLGERLQLQYGGAARLATSRGVDRFVATITLPTRTDDD